MATPSSESKVELKECSAPKRKRGDEVAKKENRMCSKTDCKKASSPGFECFNSCGHVLYCSHECRSVHFDAEHREECMRGRCMSCNVQLTTTKSNCPSCELLTACSDVCLAQLMTGHRMICPANLVKAVYFGK
jgi:hypothetical protein